MKRLFVSLVLLTSFAAHANYKIPHGQSWSANEAFIDWMASTLGDYPGVLGNYHDRCTLSLKETGEVAITFAQGEISTSITDSLISIAVDGSFFELGGRDQDVLLYMDKLNKPTRATVINRSNRTIAADCVLLNGLRQSER